MSFFFYNLETINFKMSFKRIICKKKARLEGINKSFITYKYFKYYRLFLYKTTDHKNSIAHTV